MSLRTRMKAFTLQTRTAIKSASRAETETWTDAGTLYVSMIEKDETQIYQSVKYKESTHAGVSYRKGLKVGQHRLKAENGDIYEIKSAVDDARMSNLLLRLIE